jgi:hypothetical protein
VDHDHRVVLPRFASLAVPDAAPDIDDLLAVDVGTAGAAQLSSSNEILRERVADAFEASSDVSVYVDARLCRDIHEHGRTPLPFTCRTSNARTSRVVSVSAR